MYCLSNVASLLLDLFTAGFSSLRLDRAIETFTLTSSGWVHDRYPFNFPTWFVNVLFLTYGYYGLMCYLSNNNRNHYFCFVLVGLFHGYVLLDQKLKYPFSYGHNGEAFFSFFSGVLFYEVFYHENIIPQSTLTFISFTFLVLLTALSFVYGLPSIAYDFRVVIILLFCPSFIAASIGLPCSRLLQSAFIRDLGQSAMFISFWHIPLARCFALLQSRIPYLQTHLHQTFYVYIVFLSILPYIYRSCYAGLHKLRSSSLTRESGKIGTS